MKTIIKKEKSTNLKTWKWYLSFEERKMIERMLKENISRREIGKILERGKSTICDELNRYSTTHSWYNAELAHKQFLKSQIRKWNKKKIENNERLKQCILD